MIYMYRLLSLLILLIVGISAQAQDTVKRVFVKRLPISRKLDTNEVVYNEKDQPLRYYQYQKLLNTGEYTIISKGPYTDPNSKRYLKRISQQEQNSTFEALRSMMAIKSPVLKEGMTLDVSPLKEVMSDSELDNKVVVLVFWHPECPPCTESFEQINELFRQIYNPDEVAVIAITRANTSAANAKLKEKPLLYAKFLNSAASIYSAYNLNSYPSYVVTDKKHMIRYSTSGAGTITLPLLKSSVRSALQQ
jgi:protein-disulfide isomerase